MDFCIDIMSTEMPPDAYGDIYRYNYLIRKLVNNSVERSKLNGSKFMKIKFQFNTDLTGLVLCKE